MGELILLAAVIVLTVALTWALQREFDRIERERRMREWLATNPAALKLRRDLADMQRQLGEAMLPALREVGTYMVEQMLPKIRVMAEALNASQTHRNGPLADFGGETARGDHRESGEDYSGVIRSEGS